MTLDVICVNILRLFAGVDSMRGRQLIFLPGLAIGVPATSPGGASSIAQGDRREPWVGGPIKNKPHRGVFLYCAHRRSHYDKTPLTGLEWYKTPNPGLAEYRSPWAIDDAPLGLWPGTPMARLGRPIYCFPHEMNTNVAAVSANMQRHHTDVLVRLSSEALVASRLSLVAGN